MRLRHLLPTLAFATACAAGEGVPVQPEGGATAAEGGAAAAEAGVTRIHGVAQNAKLSAVVMTEGDVVYCLDLPSWPDELVGKTVAVEGVLEQTGQFQARVDPDGAISQGTDGPVTVLRRCTLVR